MKLLKILESVTEKFDYKTLYSKYFKSLKNKFPETPDLIIEEFLENRVLNDADVVNRIENTYYGDILIELNGYYYDFLKGPWKLETLLLGYNDFTPSTKKAFIDRDFGMKNAYMVPNDLERTLYQRRVQRGNGGNKPVIMEFIKGRYEIIEGWHRIMAILFLGKNGDDPSKWDPQLITSFIRNSK